MAVTEDEEYYVVTCQRTGRQRDTHADIRTDTQTDKKTYVTAGGRQQSEFCRR